MPLEVLDDNRMIAQHRETHTLLGSVGSSRKGFQNHPVTKLYLNEHLQCLIDYHEDTVEEMERRGWTGHATPVKPEVESLALARATSSTCDSWKQHVLRIVPETGEYSIQGDMHDLIHRWTKEHKELRNDLAKAYVSSHMVLCGDKDCKSDAAGLIFCHNLALEQHKQLPNMPIRLRGNSSLHGKLETLLGAR